jgi:enoyl-CoA hydratase/carnithine racemase
MKRGENRFNPEFLAAMHAALDEVEACTGAAALVTTGDGKFYSNGLDLDWLSQQEHEDAMAFLRRVHRMFARIVGLPMATCAAINGHAFAGGGMLALAHDWRVMREDRGFFCLPELDLGMPMPVGMRSLIREKIGVRSYRDTVLTAGRFAAADCVKLGVADETRPEAEVLEAAVEKMRPLAAKSREAMKVLKRGLYAELLADLEGEGSTTIP